ALTAVALAVPPLLPLPAVASGDITAAVRADRDVVLAGDATVTVPAGTTTYTGVISGEGTLTVRGTGTLVLTKDSTFTLPAARRHQKVVRSAGGHWSVTV